MEGLSWRSPWQSIFCIAFEGLVFRPAKVHLPVRTTNTFLSTSIPLRFQRIRFGKEEAPPDVYVIHAIMARIIGKEIIYLYCVPFGDTPVYKRPRKRTVSQSAL
jgi:hypothetical protein